LLIQKNRTQGFNVWHKNAKDFFLKGGQFVDAIKRMEISINEKMENDLEEIEKHQERKEAERLAKLQQERLVLIEPYLENTFGLDLAIMSDEMFESFLIGSKTKHDAKIEAEKLEAERIEKERLAEIERQKAIEKENAKLKAEAEAKEKELAKERAEALAKQKALEQKALEERAKQDAKLKVEQEAKAKIEAELKAKKDAEIKAENERIALLEQQKKEAEKLAKAPIKEQLTKWVESFETKSPIVDNEISKEIIEKFESFKKWSLTQIEKL
jgi:membrane protein involved in colicin uptake